MTEQRRLAAILVADVVGYSRLVGQNEAGTLARLSALRREIIEPAIASHSGRLFKAMGDGFLIEFASAVQAVTAARVIQQTNAGGSLPLRIGIHVGDVVVQGDDLMGDGVNIAARIEGVADAGGIAISRAVHEQVRDKLDVSFVDKGEVSLKNLARPVQVFMLGGVASSAGAGPTPVLSLPDKPSIAVLPFQNMSGDPEQEYFADGMVEDIITALSRTKALFVIARNSSFAFKGQSPDIRDVGRRLGVRYVLEGSVRKAGNRVRITGQLIDAATGAHLWADRLDGALEDVFDLQDQVTSHVVAAIAPTLEQAEVERSSRKPTASLAAYDYSLKGWACANSLTKEANEQALAYFSRAIELDPKFALAWAQKAACYVQRKSWRWTEDAIAEAVDAERCSRQALALDANDPRVLALSGTALAAVAGFADEGLALLEKATALDPNLSFAWHQRGQWCVRLDKPSVSHFERALRLNPRDLRAPMMLAGLAFACLFEGDSQKAIRNSEEAIRQMPSFPPAMLAAIAAHATTGHIDEARRVLATFLQVHPDARISSVLDRSHLPRNQEMLADAFRRAGLPE